ncbi:glycoside hydrolase [Aspergillus heteromorphus CBS 117.55]|uniref:Glucanase n=1 Tax=Aspergillus heteromorphus CBS 117.55 TaxID=1448321 RepID=A0A317VT07_9EURO|nr:glycoside hydrolase [Aspergillus heteromorphus CBS 117.55]PWY77055.1 glycoside hydrolase [Aspergillus heteromorphus CBS 117.55]
MQPQSPIIFSQYSMLKLLKLDTNKALDSSFHTIHLRNSTTPCANSTSVDPTICPDPTTCAQECLIEGISDYSAYGVHVSPSTTTTTTSLGSVTLNQYLQTNTDNKTTITTASPRLYLLSPTGSTYQPLHLLNQEISFTVDVSNLPCGMNGALFLSEMDFSGGHSSTLNRAGAPYGTGYCDAQCYIKPWFNGVANTANVGACCNEMDLWEANARATAVTGHSCNVSGIYGCEGETCGSGSAGVCDKTGCGFNPYALGREGFYGLGDAFRVDTRGVVRVVTQFWTSVSDGSGDGNDAAGEGQALKQIRRLYIQDGVVIHNAVVELDGQRTDSITDRYCVEKGDSEGTFESHGGLEAMGKALERGMVLVFSVWNDDSSYMQWLDAGSDGPCNSTEGNPEVIEAVDPGTAVVFSDVRWGDIGSTFGV